MDETGIAMLWTLYGNRIEENKKELERIFGSDVNIFARDYATWEEGVCMFIQEVTKQKNISSIKIQNSFEKNIKKVGR